MFAVRLPEVSRVQSGEKRLGLIYLGSPSEISYRTLVPGSASLLRRLTSSLRSRELILSPSHSRALSPPGIQPQMSNAVNTTKESALGWHGFDLEALHDLHVRAVELYTPLPS